MKCPYCHQTDSKVIDSRDLRGGESIRRRRECLKCGHRFTTYERVEPINLLVIKKDGNRQEYSRQKLSKGVYTAFTKRPVKAENIEQLIDEVESEIFRSGELEVTSRQIGEILMEKLRQTDSLAYIRFASVYREFADLNVMRSEIEKLDEEDKLNGHNIETRN
ncbi:transcriptional regulator NrdR [Candidatus Chlorohelix sp.]|uniref:transcriptional regulator NrdR n=1 Tax=Candidatus Chlorohelix sp. TaxID=3139201 RepID=UPI00306D2DDF